MQQSSPPPRTRRRRRGDPPRACGYCARTFKRNEHLERHLRTHTKEKPFACSVCGSDFARRDLLTRHQRISLHGDDVAPENNVPESTDTPVIALDPNLNNQPAAIESDFAAAVSLSTLSGLGVSTGGNHHWHHHDPSLPDVSVPFADGHHNGPTGMLQNGIAPAYNPSFMAAGQGHEVVNYDHFQEFANFLDGVGLPAEWSPYFNGPDREPLRFLDPALRDSGATSATPAAARHETRPGTPFSSWLPSAPAANGNRVGTNVRENGSYRPKPESEMFRIDDEQIACLKTSLDDFRDVINPGFKLPSRHALTRYITSFFEGFHTHMNFIHVSTWSVLETPLELVLAIATVGAQYCFEHRNSERLFFAGKAVLMKRLVHKVKRLGPKTQMFLGLQQHSRNSGADTAVDAHAGSTSWEPIDTVKALIILMGYATWEPKESLVREAFALQGLLAQVVRDVGLEEEKEQPAPGPEGGSTSLHAAWLAWVRDESARRSRLIAFSFLHIHSVAYNVYPVLRSNEINLRLPCSTREWKAPTASHWEAARLETPKQQLNFQDALSLLLRNMDEAAPLDPIPTPLGNYLLLHGLLQRIFIVRDLSLPIMDEAASLPREEVEKLERGLRSWTSGWQQAPESSLDPNNENGPIPFTTSALLALAYVRIYLNLGPYRQLDTRDPARIAQALGKAPPVGRSSGVISALLYAAHALSIPIRLGVDRVARSQAFFWSVRHALSGLECAVLLSKWLCSLTGTMGATPLTDSEDRILHWVRCVVEEAWAVVDFDDGGDDLDVSANASPTVLGLAVLRIWAHFFKRNAQWPFINIIGTSLEMYRQTLLQTSR